jgi:hypothetical protein
MCHDGTGLRCGRTEVRFWGVMPESRLSQTAHEPRSARTWIKATLENRPICAGITVRSWIPATQNAPLRVERRLRPVVPMGRNRVGPLPRALLGWVLVLRHKKWQALKRIIELIC